MKKSIVEIFNEIGNFSGFDQGGNDKGSTHSYLETYDKLFAPFRDGCTMLEIGLATGDSLKIWDLYFEKSVIVGIDISIVFDFWSSHNGNEVRVIEADATKPIEQIKNMQFNVIIDDGDHQTTSQIMSFNLLKHKVKKGGYYIIEDILALDIEREKYLALHDNCQIIDMRSNGRFDNVLICYNF